MGRKKPTLKPAVELGAEFRYSNRVLGDVVTLPEAVMLWKKNRSTVVMAIAKGGLSARKTLSDGTVLITVGSLIARWGEPEQDVLADLYMPHGLTEVSFSPGGGRKVIVKYPDMSNFPQAETIQVRRSTPEDIARLAEIEAKNVPIR
jgi:hypothetical protein